MAIDFSDKRVTMVVCPVDGRYGFYALSDLAFKLLHIDIYKQEDYVVFVSRLRILICVNGGLKHVNTPILNYVNGAQI